MRPVPQSSGLLWPPFPSYVVVEVVVIFVSHPAPMAGDGPLPIPSGAMRTGRWRHCPIALAHAEPTCESGSRTIPLPAVPAGCCGLNRRLCPSRPLSRRGAAETRRSRQGRPASAQGLGPRLSAGQPCSPGASQTLKRPVSAGSGRPHPQGRPARGRIARRASLKGSLNVQFKPLHQVPRHPDPQGHHP